MFYFILFNFSIKCLQNKECVHKYISGCTTAIYIDIYIYISESPVIAQNEGHRSLSKVILIALKPSKTDGFHSEHYEYI